LRLWPEDRAAVFIHLANYYSRVADVDEAVRSARQAISLSPENPWTYLSLASIAESHGRQETAIECYEEALAWISTAQY